MFVVCILVGTPEMGLDAVIIAFALLGSLDVALSVLRMGATNVSLADVVSTSATVVASSEHDSQE